MDWNDSQVRKAMKNRRILIVDDEQANLVLLERILESLGYEATTARDGEEALGKLSDEIDLVLVDVIMPGMDGYELTRRIRAKEGFADLPVVMVTVLSSREDCLKAVQAGANDFVSKPVDTIELSVRLESLLRARESQEKIRAALREKEILLRELHHRVKNNMAVVASMLRMQSRRVKSPEIAEMFKRAAARVTSMGLVHEKLYRSDDLGSLQVRDYLEEMSRNVFHSYDQAGLSLN